MTTGRGIEARPSPLRRVPFGRPVRVPLPLVPDADLELLLHLSHGRLRRAVEVEWRLREGSDRSGPRMDWRLSGVRA